MFLGFDGSTTFGPPGSKSEVHELRDYGFISQIRKQLAAMGQTTEYWDGPWIDGFAIRGIWVQAVDFFLTHIGHDHGPNIVAGYSRGGYLAIGFSNVIEHFSKRASSAIASLQHRSILAKEIGFWRREADRIRFLWGGVDGGFSPIAHAPLIDESYLTVASRMIAR